MFEPLRCFQASFWCIPTVGVNGEVNLSSCPYGSMQPSDPPKPNISCHNVSLVRTPAMDGMEFPIDENDGLTFDSEHTRWVRWNGIEAVDAVDHTYITKLDAMREDGLPLHSPLQNQRNSVSFRATNIFGEVAECISEINQFTTSHAWNNLAQANEKEILENVEKKDGRVIYYEGSTYTIPKPRLGKNMLFENQYGDASDIRYRLQILPERPSMFLVDAVEGWKT